MREIILKPKNITEENNLKDEKLSEIDWQIDSDIAAGFPGAGIVIIKDQKIIKHSVYGYKRKYDEQGELLEKYELISSDTMFDLASNTKMYATNYAVMHLVYLGLLDIHAPINDYLPTYCGYDSSGQSRKERKVIDLLYHKAGYLPEYQFYNFDKVQQSGLYSQSNLTTKHLIQTKLDFARAIFEPPLYSDIDFILLGMIVEAITKQPLDCYVANTFYIPLGLTRTTYAPLQNGFSKADCAATEINGNTRGGTVTFPNIRTAPIQAEVHDETAYYSMEQISGHAGLFSSLSDMAVLTQLMLANGGFAEYRFWDDKVQDMFTTPNKLDSSYGLGWRRAARQESRKLTWFSRYASEFAIGHTGWTGTVTVIDPIYNLAIILLTNKKHSPFINGSFSGDAFATGQYTKIVTLAYEALLG